MRWVSFYIIDFRNYNRPDKRVQISCREGSVAFTSGLYKITDSDGQVHYAKSGGSSPTCRKEGESSDPIGFGMKCKVERVV
ncbi:hypothetical protein [Vibrio phage vB_VpaP_SJSY21]|nr:hypothetical protein [Vibrio phage vB_VpaP_SJSY21]